MIYEPGLRSGAWLKMRVNAGQEFVIGGYTPSLKNFDALVIGYYEGPKLMYAARTRNGFTPASRAQLFKKLKPLEIDECPFANLPEKKAGRWGAGLTAAKMEECPREDAHLRQSQFMGLREIGATSSWREVLCLPRRAPRCPQQIEHGAPGESGISSGYP